MHPALTWMDCARQPVLPGAHRRRPAGARRLQRAGPAALAVPHRGGADPHRQGPGGAGGVAAPRTPEVDAAAAWLLDVPEYLTMRLTGRAVAGWDTAVLRWCTDNRDPSAVVWDPALAARCGLDVRPAARAGSPRERGRHRAAGRRRRARAARRGARRRRHRRHDRGGRGRRRHRGLRRAPLRRHLGVAELPRAVQAHRRRAQHRLAALGRARRLLGRHRAGRRRQGRRLAARLGGLRPGRHARRLAPAGRRPGAAQRAGRQRATRAATGSSSPPGSTASAPRSTTRPCAAAGSTCRCRRPGPTSPAASSRASRSTPAGCWRWSSASPGAAQPDGFSSLRFIGGGASSALWCQTMADVLQIPVRQVADPVVANARGAALIAAIGVGALDWAEVPSRVAVAATYTPDPAARAVHDRQYAAFRDIYRRTHGLYARHNAGQERWRVTRLHRSISGDDRLVSRGDDPTMRSVASGPDRCGGRRTRGGRRALRRDRSVGRTRGRPRWCPSPNQPTARSPTPSVPTDAEVEEGQGCRRRRGQGGRRHHGAGRQGRGPARGAAGAGGRVGGRPAAGPAAAGGRRVGGDAGHGRPRDGPAPPARSPTASCPAPRPRCTCRAATCRT